MAWKKEGGQVVRSGNVRHSLTPPEVKVKSETSALVVPDGTVDAVLEWAGDDPAKRKAALKAEKQGQARVTLIDALS